MAILKMKSHIIKRLKEDNGIISGRQLSEELEISRVSIWKHIQKLQEMGYPIVSTAKGYRLRHCPDLLYPWEFPDRESQIHYHHEVSSTMDVAGDLARSGCPHFSVVVSEKQKNGRGRLKRSWLSSKGGLYFTVVLRPEIPPALSPLLNFSAAVAMVQTLNEQHQLNAQVKWPNDIMVSERKLAGILSKMEAEGDLVTYVNIGIGINVNNDPTKKEPNATSLKKELAHSVSRQRLLAGFLKRFEEKSKTETVTGIVSEWKPYAATLNRPVRVVTHNEVFEGVAVDVDDSGALIIKDKNDALQKIVCGDCFQT